MEPYGALSTIPCYGPMIPVVVPMIPFKAWGQEFGLVSVQGIGQNVDLDSGLGCTKGPESWQEGANEIHMDTQGFQEPRENQRGGPPI